VAEELTLFDISPEHPGKILRRLLDGKGWTQDELAAVTGRSRQTINELISGKVGVTAEMAIALAAAFGNDAAEWMKWDSAYRLSRADDNADSIQRKAKLFSIAPVRDMQRRGWIRETKNLDALEQQLRKFFKTKSLDEPFQFPVNAQRAEMLGHLNTAEQAWVFRARQIAAALPISSAFHLDHSHTVARDMRRLAAHPQEAKRAPQLLARFGIRLVIVEPLATANIDGAAFWLNDRAPVIAVTIRYDRMDSFWHTLMHEYAHIRNGHAFAVDKDLVGEQIDGSAFFLRESQEQIADDEAADSLIPRSELDSFIRRVGPLYSKIRIVQFAQRIRIHPAIVVGQLQHRKEIKFSHHHQLLPKIRATITDTALTDGWGKTIGQDILDEEVAT